MMEEAEESEQRLLERDAEHLGVEEKGMSDSLESRMTDLESKVQTQWSAFEKKWEEKIVEPESKEGTILLVDHRIRTSVQAEMEEIWKERMEKGMISQRTSTRHCTHRSNH